MIEITINKADAVASQLETLVCGMVNVVQIHFTLSEHWEGLHKTAVFTNGQTTICIPSFAHQPCGCFCILTRKTRRAGSFIL